MFGSKNKKERRELWLVKSGDRITGPFSDAEIESQIQAREVVAIDEIAPPLGRWRCVRDVSAFAKALEAARTDLGQMRDDTEIQLSRVTETEAVTGSATITLTEAGFESSVGNFEDEDRIEQASEVVQTESLIKPMREVGVGISASDVEAASIKDAEFYEEQPQRSYSTANPPSFAKLDSKSDLKSKHNIRKYGVQTTSSAGERRSSGFAFKVWIGAAVIIGFLTFFVFNSRQMPVVDDKEYQEVMSQAEESWNRGDFQVALPLLRRANQIKPGQVDTTLKLAALMLKIEGRSLEAKRLLSEAEKYQSNDESIRKIQSGLGLLALYSDDPVEALKNLRQNQLQSGAPDAIFNQGMSHYLSKSWSQAIEVFRSLNDRPEALFMLARSLEGEFAQSGEAARTQAIESLDRLVANHYPFRQEALILGARYQADAEPINVDQIVGRIHAALSLDPQLTSEHFLDPQLYLEPTGWSSLLPACKDLDEHLRLKGQEAVASSLMSFCFVQAGQMEEAGRYLAGELKRFPDDSYLGVVNAYFLSLLGRDSEAIAALKIILSREHPLSAEVLMARTCFKVGDLACARQHWTVLASKEKPELAALAGLAELQLGSANRSSSITAELKALINKLDELSPQYLKGIRLRQIEKAWLSQSNKGQQPTSDFKN